MKRFTATEKWSKEWFQELPPRLKCLWQYICDNADAAGIWEPNFKLASYLIGEAVTQVDIPLFGDRIEKLECGKFFLTRFIEFQYGKLSSECKAHTPAIRSLEKHRVSKGYPKGIQTLKDTDKDKEKDSRGSAEGETGPAEPPGYAPPLQKFIVECERYSIPAWFAEEKHGEWSVKSWRSGATPVAWRQVVKHYVARDYGNAGKPLVKPSNGSSPRRNKGPNI